MSKKSVEKSVFWSIFDLFIDIDSFTQYCKFDKTKSVTQNFG